MTNLTAYLQGFYSHDVEDYAYEEKEAVRALSEYWAKRDEEIYKALSRIQDKFDCELEIYTHACPVQIHGHIGKYHIEFHSRWDNWRLTIGEDIDGDCEYEENGIAKSDGSWMEAWEVEEIFDGCLSAYME